VTPLILAVAASLGVRRLLSRESIYTLKLVRRGRHLPKALHANMFLVRHAEEVMDPNFLILADDVSFDAILGDRATPARFQHVVVTRRGRLLGVVRVNVGLWRGLEGAHTARTLGDVVSRDFTIVRSDDLVYDVIARMGRKKAFMAVVVKTRGVPRGEDVVGVITKDHVADSVVNSIKIYPN
jgi:CIC family chloride channel protein